MYRCKITQEIISETQGCRNFDCRNLIFDGIAYRQEVTGTYTIIKGRHSGVTKRRTVKVPDDAAAAAVYALADKFCNCVMVAVKHGTFTLEAIAEMTGMTRERVRQIEEKLLRKLRKCRSGLKLKDAAFNDYRRDNATNNR